MKLAALQLLLLCLYGASASMLPQMAVRRYMRMKAMTACMGEKVMQDFKKEMIAAYMKCKMQEGDNDDDVDVEAVVNDDDSARRKRSLPRKLTPMVVMMMKEKVDKKINVLTCAFREMKLVDDDNNIDLDSMMSRITAMGLPDKQAQHLMEGAKVCHSMTECMSESATAFMPMRPEIAKLTMFMKCFNDVKIESCMLQDFRKKVLSMGDAADQVDERMAFGVYVAAAALKNMEGY